mgnify:FL=1|jgi:hypothetical protein
MKFELDLLETIAYDVLDKDEIFSNVWVLSIMKKKGYFQYVSDDMTLKEAIIMYRKLLNIK